MISNHVDDLITVLKSQPNSLWKNKALSHAQNTLACVRMMELESKEHEYSSGLREPYNASNGNVPNTLDELSKGVCTCPHGARDSNCPVHRFM